MLFQREIKTTSDSLHNITPTVQEAIRQSGVENGLCVVFCPHTTAGITINENADPDVGLDLRLGLSQAFPDHPEFQHLEGNSAAHLKSSCVGVSTTIIIDQGRLLLGTWQGIYFCEFDGPRQRRFYIKIVTG